MWFKAFYEENKTGNVSVYKNVREVEFYALAWNPIHKYSKLLTDGNSYILMIHIIENKANIFLGNQVPLLVIE